MHAAKPTAAGSRRKGPPWNCACITKSSYVKPRFRLSGIYPTHPVAPLSVKLVTPRADHVQLESSSGLICKLGTGNATAWEAAARCNSIAFPRSRGALLPSTLALRVLTDLRKQNPGAFQVCDPQHCIVVCTIAHRVAAPCQAWYVPWRHHQRVTATTTTATTTR